MVLLLAFFPLRCFLFPAIPTPAVLIPSPAPSPQTTTRPSSPPVATVQWPPPGAQGHTTQRAGPPECPPSPEAAIHLGGPSPPPLDSGAAPRRPSGAPKRQRSSRRPSGAATRPHPTTPNSGVCPSFSDAAGAVDDVISQAPRCASASAPSPPVTWASSSSSRASAHLQWDEAAMVSVLLALWSRSSPAKRDPTGLGGRGHDSPP